MLLQASRKHLLRLDRTVFIGDDPRDRLAAENADCASIIIGCENGSEDNVRAGMSMVSPTLSAALPWIFNLFEQWDASF
jgi:phosphoglycolate phosphatase-like HAD superfamily hydrolase